MSERHITKRVATITTTIAAMTLCACLCSCAPSGTTSTQGSSSSSTSTSNVSKNTTTGSTTTNAANNSSNSTNSSSSHGNLGKYEYVSSDSKGDHYYNPDDGTSLYKNKDGSIEVTDGYGTVLRDKDADGTYDTGSTDGGKTWVDVSSLGYRWK